MADYNPVPRPMPADICTLNQTKRSLALAEAKVNHMYTIYMHTESSKKPPTTKPGPNHSRFISN